MDAMFIGCTATYDHDPEFLYAVHSIGHSEPHLRIAEGANCRALQNAIERNQVLIFNWLYDVAARRPALPPTFHRELEPPSPTARPMKQTARCDTTSSTASKRPALAQRHLRMRRVK